MSSKRPSLLLSFDVEEFDLPEEYGVAVPEAERIGVAQDGMARILDVLETAGVRATMFITGYFAERSPELLRRMVSGGHEIASHGLNHTRFEPVHLAQSKALLERLAGAEVVGFRMARLAPVAKSEIVAAGYRYESSMNPIFLPGRYNNLCKPLLPFQESDGSGLWQYPISAVPWVRFPLFWLSFKNLPLWLYTSLACFSARRTGYYNMYSHPWEYSPLSREPKWNVPKYITRHAGDGQASRLLGLLNSMKKTGDFVTFRESMERFCVPAGQEQEVQ